MLSTLRPGRPDYLQRRHPDHPNLHASGNPQDLPTIPPSFSRVIYPPRCAREQESPALPTPNDQPSSTARVLRTRAAAPQHPSPWSGQIPYFQALRTSGGDQGPQLDHLDHRAPVATSTRTTPDHLFDALSKMLAETPAPSPSPPSLSLSLSHHASPGQCFCGNPAYEATSIYCGARCAREDAMNALCAAQNAAQSSSGSHYRRVELAAVKREDARARSRLDTWHFGTASSSVAPASGTRSPPKPTSTSSSSRPRRKHSAAVPPRSSSPAESSSSHASTPSLSSSATSCDTEGSHPSLGSLGYGVEREEERDFVEIGIGFAGDELRERVRRGMPCEQHRKRKLSFEEMLGLMNG